VEKLEDREGDAANKVKYINQGKDNSGNFYPETHMNMTDKDSGMNTDRKFNI